MAKVNATYETPEEIPSSSNSGTSINKNLDNNMDDGNTSLSTLTKNFTKEDAIQLADGSDDMFTGIYHTNNLYKRHEIDYFNQRYRFGLFDPYGAITNCREYLFFTKPDLNIYPRDNITGIPSRELAEYLQTQPYWLELASKNLPVIKELQDSLNTNGNRFNHLLGNTVSSHLDIPGLSSEMIETANNMYGVNIQYHGSSEASNDNFDFSLEFQDTKELSVYDFFKAYEDYQTLKHHGQLRPYYHYITDQILYDQYSIYKFLVDEDGETILYYAKLYGVTSKSLPREVFSNTTFDGGITYSVDFHAAFFDDKNPLIIKEFNKLSKAYYDAQPYQVDIYNHILDRADNRTVTAAYITTEYSRNFGTDVYKLKWRGDKKE